MTVKEEFQIWANRSATLYHRLDDVDVERYVIEHCQLLLILLCARVDDNWPLGVDGLNTNLYRTIGV